MLAILFIISNNRFGMSGTYLDILDLEKEEFAIKEARKRRREQIATFLTERNNKLKSESLLSPSPNADTAPIFPSPSQTVPLSQPDPATPQIPLHHLTSNTPQWSPDIEEQLLQLLCGWNPDKPRIDSVHLCGVVRKHSSHTQLSHLTLLHILDKLAYSGLIGVNVTCPGTWVEEGADVRKEHIPVYDISYVDVYKVKAYLEEGDCPVPGKIINVHELTEEDLTSFIEELIQSTTYRERENKRVGDEIKDLLEKPTVKERYIQEKFRTQGGSKLRTFCPRGTKEECRKVRGAEAACKRLHFKKLINQHTDEALGDCSFLNTCFHMDTCKFVHYMIDESVDDPNQSSDSEGGGKGAADSQDRDGQEDSSKSLVVADSALRYERMLYPPQYIECDLRFFNFSVLGKFDIVMADPPWDIHMELPYGTLSDDEMKALDIPSLQSDGYMFLWVTGRAMELGRECLALWGYRRVDELIWVKTNQLQRLIRTGRTGHWLNHGKEHCLVGLKGNPTRINKGLDCDVIVAEVRETSHKPDEIYGILERLSPGTLKCELFGRAHNCQRNWITLGNQLAGVKILDPLIYQKFYQYYPDGNASAKIPRALPI